MFDRLVLALTLAGAVEGAGCGSKTRDPSCEDVGKHLAELGKESDQGLGAFRTDRERAELARAYKQECMSKGYDASVRRCVLHASSLPEVARCTSDSKSPPSDGKGGWLKQIGDKDFDSVNAVAVDSDGNVYAAGQVCALSEGGVYRDGAVDFGAGPQKFVGACALFVVSYTVDGSLRWSYLDGEEGTNAIANSIALSSSGHLIVGGKRGSKMVLAELSKDGKALASHFFGGDNGSAQANSISVAADGDVLVAGEASTQVDLGTGLLKHIGLVPFIARYAPDGKARWVQFAGVASKYEARAQAVVEGPNGLVFTCGESDELNAQGGGFVQILDGTSGLVRRTIPVDRDCRALAAFDNLVVQTGGHDALITARDGEGDIKWRLPPTATATYVVALALDNDQLIAVGTEVGSTLRLIHVSADGHVAANSTFTAEMGPTTLDIDVDHRDGALIIGGQLDGPADFGIGPPIKPAPTTLQDNEDGLVVRLSTRQ